MPSATPAQAKSFLNAPLRSPLGTLFLAGTLHHTPGLDPRNMRVLGNYALILIRSGNGSYADANGKQHSFTEGDVLLIFPHLAHAYGPRKRNEWEQTYVIFNGPQFDLLASAGILSEADPIWHLEPTAFWQRRIEESLPSAPQPSDTESIRAVARFAHLLADMAATHQEAKKAPHEEWLSKSKNLLSQPAAGGWLPPLDVAQRVGYSYENFRKLFAKHAGESPGQFQKRRRIEHAAASIYQSSKSFKELADEHGFCDVFHFSKAFSQVTGESPSQYRKRVTGR